MDCKTEQLCWVCDCPALVLVKRGNIPRALSSESFAITSHAYGVTHDVYRCADCGFFQCANLTDVLQYYEGLTDTAYEKSREPRSLQERKLLEIVQRYRLAGRLLDIGAGSGILVEQALRMGFAAEGVEPSRWLHEQAKRRGLPVHLGIFPSSDVSPPYDVITLVDVLEHVPNPVGLLTDIRAALSEQGYAFVVTPDVGSFIAQLLGNRWWHYRIAHIGYFNRTTLRRAMERAGFEVVAFVRPGWYFDLAYIWERISTYLPRFLRLWAPSFFSKVIIPLNPRDSLLAICKKAQIS